MLFSVKSSLLITLSLTFPCQIIAKWNFEFGAAPLNNFLSVQSLNIRASSQDPGTFTPPGDFDGRVRWEDWTSKDGILSGADVDNIKYVRDMIDVFLERVLDEQRTGIFWTGGISGQDDFKLIDEFIATQLNGNGVMFRNWWTRPDIVAMGLDPSNKGGTYWRMVNRNSKALAAGSTNGVAYVWMNPVNCRNIFSPSSQNPMDTDPTANNQATVGEVWHFTELPTLMRNLDITQIKSFYKVDNDFKVNLEWDVNVDTDKPRDYLPDVAMDATPIILPPEAGRPPLKRSEDVYRANDSVVYGVF